VDEEERRAERLDGWIVWETAEGCSLTPSLTLSFYPMGRSPWYFLIVRSTWCVSTYPLGAKDV
jgi:hypothetical protein